VVQISLTYNQHIGSFLPSLFGWFAHHQSLLGSTEPTLSWNQLHNSAPFVRQRGERKAQTCARRFFAN
jgi:hypothetical protein